MFDNFSAQQFNKNCSPQVAGWNLQFRVLGKNYKTDSYGSCNQSFCNAKIRQLKRDILLNCKFHLYYICFYCFCSKIFCLLWINSLELSLQKINKKSPSSSGRANERKEGWASVFLLEQRMSSSGGIWSADGRQIGWRGRLTVCRFLCNKGNQFRVRRCA